MGEKSRCSHKTFPTITQIAADKQLAQHTNTVLSFLMLSYVSLIVHPHLWLSRSWSHSPLMKSLTSPLSPTGTVRVHPRRHTGGVSVRRDGHLCERVRPHLHGDAEGGLSEQHLPAQGGVPGTTCYGTFRVPCSHCHTFLWRNGAASSAFCSGTITTLLSSMLWLRSDIHPRVNLTSPPVARTVSLVHFLNLRCCSCCCQWSACLLCTRRTVWTRERECCFTLTRRHENNTASDQYFSSAFSTLVWSGALFYHRGGTCARHHGSPVTLPSFLHPAVCRFHLGLYTL